jgi:hypothetical protein
MKFYYPRSLFILQSERGIEKSDPDFIFYTEVFKTGRLINIGK